MNGSEQISNGDHEQSNRSAGSSSQIIPVIEEQLHITKQVVETGRVHISKKVVEEEYNADIPVFKEEVTIERKAMNQYIDGEVPGIRTDGNITIIPVIREVIVKRFLLVEEVHITKRTNLHSVPVHETIRRGELTIERSDGASYNDQITP